MKNKEKLEFPIPKGYSQDEMPDQELGYFKEGVCFLM